MRRAFEVVLVGSISLSLLILSETLVAQTDPPHDASKSINCFSCHLTPATADGAITNAAGNVKLCESCHTPGGLASAEARTFSDQAIPGPGLPVGQSASGTSHRWDSSVSGHALFLGGAPAKSTGQLKPGGTFAGNYAKTYTIIIAAAGDAGSATFNWTSTSPGGFFGNGVTTGTNVTLAEGLTVTFSNGRGSPSFQAGDRWQVYVRPGLNAPTNAVLVSRMNDGFMKCSTCHAPHSQAKTPFDPAAPLYTGIGSGTGRHMLSVDNDTDQMCVECHASKNVTNVLAGSHPVGISVPNHAAFQPPGRLPLDKVASKIRCLTCHQVHSSPVDDGNLLRANSQAVCVDCHSLSNAVAFASHLSPASGVLWPGGQYGSLYPAMTHATERGSCVNCHRVHGWPNAANPTTDYPKLLVDREEDLCFTCHDGNPVAKDVRSEFNKTYRHPVTLYSGRHSDAELGNPASYGTSNRHSECADCHNPHLAGSDATAPAAPAASARLRGVARVSVNNVNSTTVNYTFRPPSDPTPVKEYEVCFTCHSSWTTQPAGQSNLAADFNDQNASFHPVEARGKNLNIHANSFVNGWTYTSLTRCTDCHGSDSTTVEGPHGSSNRFILKRPYTASPSRLSTVISSNEICFECHNYDTYANNSASNTIKGYSRFNPPTYSRGHTYHVGSRRYPCYSCHETHGSTTRPNLIVTGRSPGLNNYSRTTNGGSCSPTCHGSESYSINYAR